MKVKTLLIPAIALFATIIVACSDDLNSIGSNIQPEGDDIYVGSDTVYITAETVSFEDSIYARTSTGWLGEYIDPVFGKVKSDYMCEFFCSETTSFYDNVISIDSVFLNTEFYSFTGDSISPMGISIYEVTSSLKPFFFTSTDPSLYTDNMSKLLGQSIFSIQDLHDTVYSTVHTKSIPTKLDLSLGNRFHEEWQDNPATFSNSDELKKFFKGVYVTTTFGSGSLMNTNYTDLSIHYTYLGRNTEDTEDSIRVATFYLPVTTEVIQMNQIQNSIPKELYTHNETKTYVKTPAGVYTRLTIPLNEIMEKSGKDRVLNATTFKLKGYTDEEEKTNLPRPSNLLLVNEDSLQNFFFNRKLFDNNTSYLVSRTSTTGDNYNSYDFKNISTIINHYADYYKDEETLPDLHYLLIPVSVTYSQTSTSSSLVVSDIYNLMSPTSAIFRTDPENMKMAIIFSKYNDNKQ